MIVFFSSWLPAASSPRSSQAASTLAPPPAAAPGRELPASYDRALDAPPASALDASPASPEWLTSYGTELGRGSLGAHIAPAGIQPQGPKVDVGLWSTFAVSGAGGSVSAIVEDPDGRVFVGVPGVGVRVYQPAPDGGYSWATISATAGGLASNAVTALAIYGNELWVGTAANGISVRDLASGAWKTFTTANSPLPSNSVTRIGRAPNPNGFNSLWVSTTKGAANYTIFLGSANWEAITTANGLQYEQVRDVAVQVVNNKRYTWFSTIQIDTNFARGSLARWDGTSWSYFNDSNTGACQFTTARRIVVDQRNHVWFAAQQAGIIDDPDAIISLGLCRYTGTAWNFFSTADPGLPSNIVLDLALDSAQRLWMTFEVPDAQPAANVAGVYEEGRWEFYGTGPNGLGGRKMPVIASVGERIWFGQGDAATATAYAPFWQRAMPAEFGGSGAIQAMLIEPNIAWFGVGAGLAWRDSAGWSYRAIPGNAAAVTAIVRVADGTLRIGTQGQGIWSWNGSGFSNQQTTAHGLPSATIQDLHFDSGGRLWAATPAGLALQGQGYWMTLTAATSLLPADDIRALTSDKAGRLWIGTAAHGIAVYDPAGAGDGAWALVQAPTLVPGNAIRALSTDEQGFIWAGTTSGVGRWNPATNAWANPAAPGTLPSASVLSIASTGKGTIVVGTDRGAALITAQGVQKLYVSGTSMLNGRVLAVAGDAERIWFGAGAIAVRGLVTLGKFPPSISSVTPDIAEVGALITVKGANFDPNPLLNMVRFASSNHTVDVVPGDVVAATASTLTVRVPPLASAGMLRVETRGLKSPLNSSVVFRVKPTIASFNACLGIGDQLIINGAGFFGAGASGVKIKIGLGQERAIDSVSADRIVQVIRPDDTSGMITVVLPNGMQAQSGQPVAIGSIGVAGVQAQQAIEGEQMIWGKPTLFQLRLKSTTGCAASVDSGEMTWVRSDGTTQFAAVAFLTAKPLIVDNTLPSIPSLSETANFVGRFDYSNPRFPLSQLSAVRFTLRRGGMDVKTFEAPAGQFDMLEVANPFYTIMNLRVLSNSSSWEETNTFESTIWANLQHVERNFPYAPSSGHWADGESNWLYNWSSRIRFADSVNLDSDDYENIIDWADDLRENANDLRCDVDPCRPFIDMSVAVIDPNLYTPDTASGKARKPGTVATAFNFPDTVGHIYLQEVAHALDAVEESAPNHAAGNKFHSRYDEGGDSPACNNALTYRQAVIDQRGSSRRVVRLDDGDPVELSGISCAADTPKSTLAYVPGADNSNTFLEPLDVAQVWSELDISAEALSLKEGLPPYTRTLRLNGAITAHDAVTVTLSYLLGAEGTFSRNAAASAYRVVLRSASGQILLNYGFDVNRDSTHTHGHEEHSARFNLRIPFPAGADRAELYHGTARLWSRQVSRSAPTVAFVAPAGGSYSANQRISVSWSARDRDRDALQTALDYSPDNGVTWLPVAIKLPGTVYDWEPGFVPSGTQARLRLRVSDGFHTAAALSSPFTLTGPKPVAMIANPQPQQTFTEGQPITLVGGSRTADGYGTGLLQWKRNGSGVGWKSRVQDFFAPVGANTYEFSVTANGQDWAAIIGSLGEQRQPVGQAGVAGADRCGEHANGSLLALIKGEKLVAPRNRAGWLTKMDMILAGKRDQLRSWHGPGIDPSLHKCRDGRRKVQ
ncbi:MAG TPA: two-component regulator propeller domain-containing protein [Herpetosiphonaceae bacterium]|nr:two-component regulator propeller domain-containing protein [Herpetosiphonaceae bacterium]